MKKKGDIGFWPALALYSLIGQVAWVVENMYLNVFIYKMFSASADDISRMVAASAVAATLTTVFVGALSDRLGRRKPFMCWGYILWGISILGFSLIRPSFLDPVFGGVGKEAPGACIAAVIILDCVMTFFGSSANDAAFNAWLTDVTNEKNRGAAEGVNAMMPLLAILAVFGGFMAFDLDVQESWTSIFCIIGGIVIAVGVLGFFLIREPKLSKSGDGYLSTVFYGFTPSSVGANPALYLCLGAFVIFNISIQIFMPYLIIYYEVSLGMTDYVLVMAPAIVLASLVTVLWGRVYDQKGFRLSAAVSLVWLLLGYGLLFFCRERGPVFIGSLLMMSGYLSGTAVFGARIRDNTPDGKAGRLQGIRIFSVVLLPGVIGPMIGKWVLSGAETVVGNDGMESFIPSAEIFGAAAIPAALLLLLILLFVRGGRHRTVTLDTPYRVGEIPYDHHPDPTLQRDAYVNLNGAWAFSVRRGKRTVYEGTIRVPFPPESPLSGVERITKPGDVLFYSRTFRVDRGPGERVLLHFGAVDQSCTVEINKSRVGTHTGGYLPFTIDITEQVQRGDNTLSVAVTDPLDRTLPYGKQRHKRGGMWYTPVSGIWQTVWLEIVPEHYIRSLRVTPTLDTVTFSVEGGAAEKCITLLGREYRFSGDTYTLSVPEPVLWTPENPHLYRFTLSSGEDSVQSYFALRQIGTVERNGRTWLALNGKPYFFHGLLDQGYYPDGIYTPASAEAYRDDILRMKTLGFNMLRKHIKVEPRIFYYFCDLYGMAVFQDMVNNGGYSFVYDTALPTVGFKRLPRHEPKRVRDAFFRAAGETVAHLYNHPSVVYYTVFNEGWGQFGGDAAYERLKTADGTRIYDAASGWFAGGKTDVQSEHVYFKRAAFPVSPHLPAVLSEFGGYSCNVPGHVFNLDRVYGYRICPDTETLTSDLCALYRDEVIPLIRQGLSGAVLTQVSDVEDETNGLLTYDRHIVKPEETAMRAVAEQLQRAFAETVAPHCDGSQI